MKQTETYQLSQWEASDRIRREDFNRDNANIETGLVELQESVAAEQSAREEAVAAAEAKMNARVDAIPLVKLAEVNVTAEMQQLDLNVEKFPLSSYFQLILIPELEATGTSSGVILVRCNNLSDKVYAHGSNNDTYWASLSGKSRASQILIVSGSENVLHLWKMHSNLSTMGLNGGGLDTGSVDSDLTPADLRTINFVASDGNAIQPGGKVTLFGLKR